MTKTHWQWLIGGATLLIGVGSIFIIGPLGAYGLTIIGLGLIVWLQFQKRHSQPPAQPSLAARWVGQLDCPLCRQPMEKGWIAIYEPIIITRAIWQAERPGYVRMVAPETAVKVIQPQVGGRGCPETFLCRACEITVSSYDRRRAT